MGSCERLGKLVREGCMQGCELSPQPCKVNTSWLRNGEQKYVLSAGKSNVSAWTPQSANCSREPDGLHQAHSSVGWPHGTRRGLQPGQPSPSQYSPAEKSPSHHRQMDIAYLWESPNVLHDMVCYLLILPQQRAQAGCQQGCTTHAAST